MIARMEIELKIYSETISGYFKSTKNEIDIQKCVLVFSMT